MEPKVRLAVCSSGAGPELPFWRNRDYILYRSGEQAQMSVEQAGEALEFVNGRYTLSDHPAVYAYFRVRAIQRKGAEEPGECRPFELKSREPVTFAQ